MKSLLLCLTEKVNTKHSKPNFKAVKFEFAAVGMHEFESNLKNTLIMVKTAILICQIL